MTYAELVRRIEFLDAKFKNSGLVLWYFSVPALTVGKVIRWSDLLGYEEQKHGVEARQRIGQDGVRPTPV